MVFLMPIAMLKAVPNENAGFIILFTSFFILFYFMRSLSMSFYFILKTSSRFNGFYRNPAGLPGFTPARVAPTRVAPTSVAPARVAAELGLPLAGLPRQGCPQGDIALTGLPRQPTQELCTFSATALPTSSSSRTGEASSSFSMKFCFVAQQGFKCHMGPRCLKGPV